MIILCEPRRLSCGTGGALLFHPILGGLVVQRARVRRWVIVVVVDRSTVAGGLGFLFNPLPPKNSVTAVECDEDGGSALASRLSKSEHIGMLIAQFSIAQSKTDPLCRKVTGPVWRRCADSTFGVMANPRLGDARVFPSKKIGCEYQYAHHLETI